MYRHLDHVQAELYCLNLHFNGPAETTILHLEILQGAESDCAEWAQIADRHLPDQSNKQAGDEVTNTLSKTIRHRPNKFFCCRIIRLVFISLSYWSMGSFVDSADRIAEVKCGKTGVR